MNKRMTQWLHLTLQFIVALAFALPLYWTVVTATDASHMVYQLPPNFIPQFHFGPFLRVWSHTPWLRYILNTIFIAVSTVLLVLLTSILAGYALSHLHFPGKNLVFLSIMGVMMLPAQALLIPQYDVLLHLNLLNTYAGQIIPFAASTFGVFLFRQYFLTIPKAYWEAAYMEGANTWQYLRYIAVPLAIPALVTTALLTFIAAWNQFQWPLIITQSRSIQPLEVVLGHYMQTYQANWRELSSAVLIALVPIILLFFFAQKYIVQGVAGRNDGLK